MALQCKLLDSINVDQVVECNIYVHWHMAVLLLDPLWSKLLVQTHKWFDINLRNFVKNLNPGWIKFSWNKLTKYCTTRQLALCYTFIAVFIVNDKICIMASSASTCSCSALDCCCMSWKFKICYTNLYKLATRGSIINTATP